MSGIVPPVKYPHWISPMEDGWGNLRAVGPGLYVGDEMAVAKAYACGLIFDTIFDVYGSAAQLYGSACKILGLGQARVVEVWPFDDGAAIPCATLDRAWHCFCGAEGPMLVQCQAGLSRSASVAYALLRRKWNHSHARALRRVEVPEFAGQYPRPKTLSSARAWVGRR